MTTRRTMLKFRNGVTLSELSLQSGGSSVAVTYIVETSRTPETFSFSNIDDAEIGFEREVDRSSEAKVAQTVRIS